MKPKLKKMVGIVIFFLLVIFGMLAIITYNQEKVIFYPTQLRPGFQFSFPDKFEEKYIESFDGVKLHGLLFKSDSTKGLVFYLHGNAGALNTWGEVAGLYLKNNYDVFILDYRGYGKSMGKIKNETQLHKDVQIVYDQIKSGYEENQIIVIGFSLGTGLASRLAANNHPKMLILKAPFYNLPDLIHHSYPFIPKSIIKFKMMTNEQLPKISVPIIIFHGDRDDLVYYGSSEKLKSMLKPTDKFITLSNQSHNGINENQEYARYIDQLLK